MTRMRTPTLLALALLVALAVPAASATVKAGAQRSATAAKAKSRAKAAEWKPVVPFIEDDFGRALALAKERKLPVFIEGWAPW
jgi:hypothetical protein